MVIWVIKFLLYSSSVYSCHLFLIYSASVRSIPFLSFIMPIFAWNVALSSVQFSPAAQSCLTLCDLMNHSMPGLPVHHQLTEFTQIHVHWVSDAIQPSRHPSSLLLPSIFPSIKVFSNESALRIRWPKYWSFSFNISPSNEHPGLISVRIDWLDLLAVQGTLKSLLQHHSSKASVLLCSAFCIVQLSHPYMTTGKTKALTRQTFVGKVMSLLLNMLFTLVIAFLFFFHFFFLNFFNFTIFYWFCHILTWIHHRYTRVEPSSLLPILNPPPSFLPIPSLWVIPVHQP